MLEKIKKDAGTTTPCCGQKTFKFLARMTKNAKSSSSPYKKMESDCKEKKCKKCKKLDEVCCKGKENNNMAAKEIKEKKSKKKGWKRVRQVALTTCRYIGMGAAHMSPATVYSSPDYYIDPKCWNKSFSSSYKPKVPPPPPHWTTTTIMFSSW